MDAEEQGKLEGPITINIGNVCGGAMVEAFELRLREVLQNIMDPNTEARKAREVRLVLTINPKDDRVTLNTEFQCTTKLAGMIPATSLMYVGKDQEGVLYALTEDPRQMNFFTPPKPKPVREPIAFVASK
jgi:hypothetical protein